MSRRVPWLVFAGGSALTLLFAHSAVLLRTPVAVMLVGWCLTLLLASLTWLAHAAQTRAIARETAEGRLRDFLDAAGEPIEIVALDGAVLEVNRAWRQTFGYTEGEAPTRSTVQMVAPEYADAYRALRSRLIEGEAVEEFEAVFVTRQKRRLVLTVRLTCGFESGHPSFVRAILRDVTPQRAAEEAQARLVATLDATTDFVAVANGKGRAVYINRAGRRMIGIGDDEDVSTIGLSSVFAPGARQYQMEVVLPAATRDGVWEGESMVHTRDSRDVPVSQVVIAHQSSQGGVWFVSTIMRDISVQRRREDELRDSEERFRRLSDAATDGIAISRDGRFLEVNRAWCRMFGYDEAELSRISAMDLAAATDRTRVERSVMANQSNTYELVCRRKDGSTFEAQATGSPIIYKGNPARVTVVRDISEWKRLDRMKSEFVSTVSHELRTPLTSIRGALGLLESGVAGTLSPQALDLARIGRSNSERLIRLISDMLDLDKIEAGVLQLRPSTLMPAEVVRAAVDGIRALADQLQIRLEEQVEAHRTFEGDRDRVIQVLTNLLSNAVKFSPAGSVVTVSALPVASSSLRAGFTSESAGHVTGRAPVRFVVENPGSGIAPDDLARLFRRFQQLDSSDGRARGGTGLGLAISKAIVEQHGGRIGVESAPGAMTTFWFELPSTLTGARSTPLADADAA